MLPEIKNGSILAQFQSLFLCSDVYICYALSACFLSLFWNEWPWYEAPCWLTGPMRIHSMLALQHRPWHQCPGLSGLAGMQWKGPVASTGGPVLLCNAMTVFMPTVLGQVCSTAVWSCHFQAGAVSTRWPCAHRCAVHMEGHRPRWQPPLNPDANVGRAGDRETALRESWIYTEFPPPREILPS